MNVAESYRTGSGEEMHRYWVHRNILVGGMILDEKDARHLRETFGVAAVLNVASEESDTGKGVLHLLEVGQPDDGSPRSPLLVRAAVVAVSAWERAGIKVYIHCMKGMVRSPSYAYAALRGLGWAKEAAFDAVRSACPWGWGHEVRARAYIDSIEEALR